MPLISRASIGAEFEDRTSPLLLVQPEPQYVYGQLWKMALRASLAQNTASLGWRAPEIGREGYPYPNAEKDRLILEDVFRDEIFEKMFVNVAELGNERVGHTVRLNRPLFTNTTYTQSAREVANGTLISTTPVNLGSEQVSVTIKRFAGPYDQTNNNVAPYGVDRFDASRAIHSTAELVGTQLQRDFDRTIDTMIGEYLALSANVVYANGYTATTSFYGGQATGGLNSAGYGEAPFSISMMNQIEKTMNNANLPTMPNGRRPLFVSPTALQELKDDPNYLKMTSFHPPKNYILAQSYKATIGQFDVFQSTTLPTTTNGNSGQTVYQVQSFAPGVIASGLGGMPRVASSSADNYGEWALVVWILYGGFSLADSRFGCIGYHN